jgi:tight adherence protein B
VQIEGNAFFVITVLVFVTVLLLLEGLYLLWKGSRGPQARKLKKRLMALSQAQGDAKLLRAKADEVVSMLDKLAHAVPGRPRFERILAQSGLSWTIARWFTLSVAFAAAAWFALVSLAHQELLVALGAAALALLVPTAYVAHKRQRRMRCMEQQLPDALDLISRALRAGHAFSSTLKMAGEELPEPIGSEIRFTHDEITFGISMQEALTNFSERIPLTDVRYFVVAVLIQRESGGNLTEILANLGRLVRDRLKLLARVRVLSAEGRMSAWILTLLPFALAGMMNIFNPKFMSPLWKDPIGIAIVKYMLILMFFGVLIMRRIIKVRY